MLLNMRPSSAKQITEEEALKRLSDLCAQAEYCPNDIRRKMSLWQLSEELQQRILERLEVDHFIDELRYARAFVRDKFRYNRWGPKRLEMELRCKGIAVDLIQEALMEITPQDANETLLRLLQAKVRTTRGRNDYERAAKLVQFALRKGFLMEDARRIAGQILDGIETDTPENVDGIDAWHHEDP